MRPGSLLLPNSNLPSSASRAAPQWQPSIASSVADLASIHPLQPLSSLAPSGLSILLASVFTHGSHFIQPTSHPVCRFIFRKETGRHLRSISQLLNGEVTSVNSAGVPSQRLYPNPQSAAARGPLPALHRRYGQRMVFWGGGLRRLRQPASAPCLPACFRFVPSLVFGLFVGLASLVWAVFVPPFCLLFAFFYQFPGVFFLLILFIW